MFMVFLFPEFMVYKCHFHGRLLLAWIITAPNTRTTDFRDKIRQANAMLAYTPPGLLKLRGLFTRYVLCMIDCTDCISPCDHHFGARLKEMMSWYYKAEFRNNKAAWIRGDLTAQDRRMLMAQWAYAAWAALRLDRQKIKAAFVNTSFKFCWIRMGRNTILSRFPESVNITFVHKITGTGLIKIYNTSI